MLTDDDKKDLHSFVSMLTERGLTTPFLLFAQSCKPFNNIWVSCYDVITPMANFIVSDKKRDLVRKVLSDHKQMDLLIKMVKEANEK